MKNLKTIGCKIKLFDFVFSKTLKQKFESKWLSPENTNLKTSKIMRTSRKETGIVNTIVMKPRLGELTTVLKRTSLLLTLFLSCCPLYLFNSSTNAFLRKLKTVKACLLAQNFKMSLPIQENSINQDV